MERFKNTCKRGITPIILLIATLGLLLAGCGVWLATRSPTTAPTEEPQTEQTASPVSLESRDGTCEEFLDYIKTTGVTYQQGGETKTKPKAPGATIVEPADVKPSILDEKETTPQRFSCNCNGKTYDDLDLCLEECKASLGCFTGICNPVEGTYICVEVTYKVVFTPKINSYALQWNPPQGSSEACTQMAENWNKKVRDHEKSHYDAELDVINRFNDKWKDGIAFKGCGKTKKEAKTKAEKKFLDQLGQDMIEIELESDVAEAELHAQGATIEPLDCSKCP